MAISSERSMVAGVLCVASVLNLLTAECLVSYASDNSWSDIRSGSPHNVVHLSSIMECTVINTPQVRICKQHADLCKSLVSVVFN